MKKIILAAITLFNIVNVNAQCVQSVAAGQDHSLAIDNNNSLWAWGENVYSSLGDNTTIDRHLPVRIDTLTTWASVSTVYYHNLA